MRKLTAVVLILLLMMTSVQAETMIDPRAERGIVLQEVGLNETPEGVSPTTGRTLAYLPKFEGFAGLAITGRYLPMLVQWMRKEKDQNPLRRFVFPALALAGSVFMVIACVFSHRMACLWYLIVFVVIMLIGRFFEKPARR